MDHRESKPDVLHRKNDIWRRQVGLHLHLRNVIFMTVNALLIYVISTERISVIVHKEGQQQAILSSTVTQAAT